MHYGLTAVCFCRIEKARNRSSQHFLNCGAHLGPIWELLRFRKGLVLRVRGPTLGLSNLGVNVTGGYLRVTSTFVEAQ